MVEKILYWVTFLHPVCWHLLLSDSSCPWTSGDRAGQTRQECLKWGSRANQETDSCVQHGLSKSLQLLFQEPWWILSFIRQYVVFISRCLPHCQQRRNKFLNEFGQKMALTFNDSNPPHRKHTSLKCDGTWQMCFYLTLLLL